VLLGGGDVATSDRLEWHALSAAGPALRLARDNSEPFEPPVYKPTFLPALDREFLAELLVETYRGSLDFPELGETADRVSVQFEVELFHRRGGRSSLMVVGGKVVGAAQVMEEPDDGASVSYLGVVPEYRQRGIAAGALAEILRGGFTPRRPREVTLWVDGRNAPALRLYEGFGFRVESAHRLHVGWRYGNG
jgi:ribosomal protein S18 acetylase RimI-like enzyme